MKNKDKRKLLEWEPQMKLKSRADRVHFNEKRHYSIETIRESDHCRAADWILGDSREWCGAGRHSLCVCVWCKFTVTFSCHLLWLVLHRWQQQQFAGDHSSISRSSDWVSLWAPAICYGTLNGYLGLDCDHKLHLLSMAILSTHYIVSFVLACFYTVCILISSDRYYKYYFTPLLDILYGLWCNLQQHKELCLPLKDYLHELIITWTTLL